MDVRVRAAHGRGWHERRRWRARVRVCVEPLNQTPCRVAVRDHLVGRHEVATIVGRDDDALAVLPKGDGRGCRARERRARWVERPRWRRWTCRVERRRVRGSGQCWWRGRRRRSLLIEAHLAAQLLGEERVVVRMARPLELIAAKQDGRVAVDGHTRERHVVVRRNAAAQAGAVVADCQVARG